MKSLPVVLCLLALAGAAALAALYVRADRARDRLATTLSSEQSRLGEAFRQLAESTEANRALEEQRATLETNLADTRSTLALSETKNEQLAAELDRTKSLLDAREQAERELQQQIAALQRDLAEARQALVPPETLEAYRNTIADLERQLATAHAGAVAPGTAGASTAAFANRRPVSAEVLSVGPSNSFVVLNYGAGRGAAHGQRLLIRRGTETLAMVLIGDVRPSVSIAHVQPDSLRGVLHKGDSAVLTN